MVKPSHEISSAQIKSLETITNFYLKIILKMKITENIKSFIDIMNTLKQLDDPIFVEENQLTPEDIELVKQELKKKVSEQKEEAIKYVIYKLKERKEHQILSNWISEEIKTFTERKKIQDNAVKGIDNWIDYICKTIDITELKDPAWEIKYTWAPKMKVTTDWVELLPDELKSFSLSDIKVWDIEKIKELWYDIASVPLWLPEIKKWYSQLEKSWDEQTKYLWDQLKANVITQQEHDEELAKIVNEKKKYDWKIWIDDSKSISIK